MSTALRTTRRANRYAGNCQRNCGHRVEAEAGLLVRTASGWGAEHDGPCPTSAPAAPTELESGMYRNGETIFKVYRAVHGSGLMVAKRLNVQAQSFEYLGLAERFVKAEHRMSHEQAVEFGRIYGFCVRCAATLTDEESIARGMGPICAEKI